MTEPLLSVENLSVSFGLPGRSRVRALHKLSLTVRRGETVALMGESGSGKSTLARAILQLVPLVSGRISFQGKDVTHARGAELYHMRTRVQMIFQNPAAALHPRFTARESILEPLSANGVSSPDTRIDEVAGLCALDQRILGARPSALSGGQLQRVAIARALALRPELLIADEPLSALDVSLQAQITSLLLRLRRELGLAMLFISHDLALVRQFADRILILYGGTVVEEGPVESVIFNPQHPYTVALIAASPDPGRPWLEPILETDVPAPAEGGCVLAPRCPHRQPHCREVTPEAVTVSGRDPRRRVACHFPGCAGNPLGPEQALPDGKPRL